MPEETEAIDKLLASVEGAIGKEQAEQRQYLPSGFVIEEGVQEPSELKDPRRADLVDCMLHLMRCSTSLGTSKGTSDAECQGIFEADD